MSQSAGESSRNISKATIADLKAITAEHVDQFSKTGRAPVKGQPRRSKDTHVKDPFQRESPGLLKRLAAEARNDAKRRHFQDDPGPSDEQRRAILEKKAKQYAAMSRGDISGLSDKQLAELSVDFEAKQWQSDEQGSEDSNDSDDGDHLDQVEYMDELGRTRIGTRREAREARAAMRRDVPETTHEESATEYSAVQQSHLVYGDQNMFPVYEPDADVIKEKYRAAEEESRPHHYDATREVRARAAGQYQFSLDEEERARQMESLKNQRADTERARAGVKERQGLSAAQLARKRRLDERRLAVEAKRAKLLGGADNVARLREEKRAREAEKLLEDIEGDIQHMHAA